MITNIHGNYTISCDLCKRTAEDYKRECPEGASNRWMTTRTSKTFCPDCMMHSEEAQLELEEIKDYYRKLKRSKATRNKYPLLWFN